MFLIRNALLRRDVQFLFQKFQSLDQSRQAFLFAFIVKPVQTLVGFAFTSFAIREFVGRKAFVVTRRSG